MLHTRPANDESARAATTRTPPRTGVSFLPMDCGTYQQTPYEKVERETYEELLSRMPPAINWAGLRKLERAGGEDKCEFELACTANGCEMVDIV